MNILLLHHRDNSEDLDDSTTLKVHFKDLTCIKYRRDMYMTWDGLFGNQIQITFVSSIINYNKISINLFFSFKSLIRWHFWIVPWWVCNQFSRANVFFHTATV